VLQRPGVKRGSWATDARRRGDGQTHSASCLNNSGESDYLSHDNECNAQDYAGRRQVTAVLVNMQQLNELSHHERRAKVNTQPYSNLP